MADTFDADGHNNNSLTNNSIVKKSHRSFLKHQQQTRQNGPYQYSPRKTAQLLDQRAIQLRLRQKCCNNECTKEFTVSQVISVQKTYAEATEQKRSELLLAFIKFNYDASKPLGQQYFLKGQPICFAAVLCLYRCSKAKLQGVHCMNNAGGLIPFHGSTGAKRIEQRKEQLATWLLDYFTWAAEAMPNGDLHILYYLKWTDLHREYCETVSEPYSFKVFRTIIITKFPKVFIFSKNLIID